MGWQWVWVYMWCSSRSWRARMTIQSSWSDLRILLISLCFMVDVCRMHCVDVRFIRRTQQPKHMHFKAKHCTISIELFTSELNCIKLNNKEKKKQNYRWAAREKVQSGWQRWLRWACPAHSPDMANQQLHVMVFNVCVISLVDGERESEGERGGQRKGERERLVFALLIYFITFRYRSIAAKTRTRSHLVHKFVSRAFLVRSPWRKWSKCEQLSSRWSYFEFPFFFQYWNGNKTFLFFNALTIDARTQSIYFSEWREKSSYTLRSGDSSYYCDWNESKQIHSDDARICLHLSHRVKERDFSSCIRNGFDTGRSVRHRVGINHKFDKAFFFFRTGSGTIAALTFQVQQFRSNIYRGPLDVCAAPPLRLAKMHTNRPQSTWQKKFYLLSASFSFASWQSNDTGTRHALWLHRRTLSFTREPRLFALQLLEEKNINKNKIKRKKCVGATEVCLSWSRTIERFQPSSRSSKT